MQEEQIASLKRNLRSAKEREVQSQGFDCLQECTKQLKMVSTDEYLCQRGLALLYTNSFQYQFPLPGICQVLLLPALLSILLIFGLAMCLLRQRFRTKRVQQDAAWIKFFFKGPRPDPSIENHMEPIPWLGDKALDTLYHIHPYTLYLRATQIIQNNHCRCLIQLDIYGFTRFKFLAMLMACRSH